MIESREDQTSSEVEDIQNVIFAHIIYNSPIISINNNYDIWESLNPSIAYEYVVNGMKYLGRRARFS